MLTGRECGTSASSAPSVTTIWTPSASASSTIDPQNVRQRYRGLGAVQQDEVARRARDPRLVDLDRPASRSSRCCPSTIRICRPRGLEVVELLGVDLREALAPRPTPTNCRAADAASPASFQPLNAHTSAGARSPSGRRSQRSGCIRSTVHHGPRGNARAHHAPDPRAHRRAQRRCAPATRSTASSPARARTACRAHRARPTWRSSCATARRAARRACSATPTCSAGASTAATSCASGAGRALPRRAAGRRAGDRSARRRAPTRRVPARRLPRPRRARRLPRAPRARGPRPRLSRAARLACSATRRCAPRGAGRRARAPATTPTSAACSSTRSRSRTLAQEACLLHPRLNSRPADLRCARPRPRQDARVHLRRGDRR